MFNIKDVGKNEQHKLVNNHKWISALPLSLVEFVFLISFRDHTSPQDAS